MTNREKYKEIEERAKMFCKFCSSQGSCVNCQLNKVDAIPHACAYAWEELEYKEELLPCPFCGGDGVVCKYDDEGHNAYAVECTKCECRILCCESKEEEAIEKWNRRTDK